MPSFDSEIQALQSEEIGKPIRYSVVDLDADTEFNVNNFDSSIKALLKTPRSIFNALQDAEQELKFIVASSQTSTEGTTPHTKIYVFDPNFAHAQFLSELQKKNGVQSLFSAGLLEITFDSPYSIKSRNLTGYSESLEKMFGLEKERSDTYRKEVLIQKLGNSFSAKDKFLATSSPVA